MEALTRLFFTLLTFAINETSCSNNRARKGGQSVFRGPCERVALDSSYNNMTEMSVN